MKGGIHLSHPSLDAWHKVCAFFLNRGIETEIISPHTTGNTTVYKVAFLYKGIYRLLEMRCNSYINGVSIVEEKSTSRCLCIWVGFTSSNEEIETVMDEALKRWALGVAAEDNFVADMEKLITNGFLVHKIIRANSKEEMSDATDFFLKGAMVSVDGTELFWYEIPVDIKASKKLENIQFFLREQDNVYEFAWSEEDWGNLKKLRVEIKKLVLDHLSRYNK